MPHTQHPDPTTFDFTGVKGPACSPCGAQMMLALSVPANAGFDLRTFKCQKCEISETLLIAVSSPDVRCEEAADFSNAAEIRAGRLNPVGKPPQDCARAAL